MSCDGNPRIILISFNLKYIYFYQLWFNSTGKVFFSGGSYLLIITYAIIIKLLFIFYNISYHK